MPSPVRTAIATELRKAYADLGGKPDNLSDPSGATEAKAMNEEADGTQTFECLKCQAPYRAYYKIFTQVREGEFNCECGGAVYAWSGVRDYFKWERV